MVTTDKKPVTVQLWDGTEYRRSWWRRGLVKVIELHGAIVSRHICACVALSDCSLRQRTVVAAKDSLRKDLPWQEAHIPLPHSSLSGWRLRHSLPALRHRQRAHKPARTALRARLSSRGRSEVRGRGSGRRRRRRSERPLSLPLAWPTRFRRGI